MFQYHYSVRIDNNGWAVNCAVFTSDFELLVDFDVQTFATFNEALDAFRELAGAV